MLFGRDQNGVFKVFQAVAALPVAWSNAEGCGQILSELKLERRVNERPAVELADEILKRR